MASFASHFARALPIVGPALCQKRVGLLGCAAGAEVAALLAASGVLRWALATGAPAALDSPLARRFGPAYTRQGADTALAAALRAHHGERLPWAFVPLGTVGYDLLIAAGAPTTIDYAKTIAARRGCPLVALPSDPRPDPATWADGFPVATLAGPTEAYLTPDPYAAAAVARALLLRGTPFARPDIEALLVVRGQWAVGSGQPSVGSGQWAVGSGQPSVGSGQPSSFILHPSSLPQPVFATPLDAPALRERTALVVGLGSLGSLIALELGRVVRKLVVVDGATVTDANPARQLYRAAMVGQPKAVALADELRARLGTAAPTVVGLTTNLRDEQQVAALVAAEGGDLAVLTTGTVADFALARGLRAAGVPHLAARCYPRARYWETLLVPDGAVPCLGCLRGHLYAGPTPPPTPEEAARYAAPGDLMGEPATLVESGWAAACVSLLALQLLAPPGLREGWMLDLLASGRTCLIGGAYTLDEGHGAAYGLTRPGQVRAFGVESIAGSAAERVCADCGRTWPVGVLIADSR